MKLNIGDRIKYDESIYTVAAVLFSTVYLRTDKSGCKQYDYDMKDVYNFYKDIECFRKDG